MVVLGHVGKSKTKAKWSGGADRISGTRGVSVQWRALDTFRRLENICPRGDQKPPFVLPSGAKIKRHSRGPAHSGRGQKTTENSRWK